MKSNALFLFLVGFILVGCEANTSTVSHQQSPEPFLASKYMPLNTARLVEIGLITEGGVSDVSGFALIAAASLDPLLYSDDIPIDELHSAVVGILNDDHSPAVQAYLEQLLSMLVLDHARDHGKDIKPEHAGYFVDMLLKHENSNAYLVAYALDYIEGHWSDESIASSASKAADLAEKWLAKEGLHKTTPQHEKDNDSVVGVGSAKSLQMQALEIAIEQLREM